MSGGFSKRVDLLRDQTSVAAAQPVVAANPVMVISDHFAAFIKLLAKERPAHDLAKEAFPRTVAAARFHHELRAPGRDDNIG